MAYVLLTALGILGFADSAYLTYEHYNPRLVICDQTSIFRCENVLESQYAEIFGVPVALIGALYYIFLTILSLYAVFSPRKIVRYGVFFLSSIGFVASLYFLFLQIVVIKAICPYCVISAIICFTIFFVSRIGARRDYQRYKAYCTRLIYRNMIKPVLFSMSPEKVHTYMTGIGQLIGSIPLARAVLAWFWTVRDPALQMQTPFGTIDSPLGLSAGFDYEVRLPRVIGSIGFGFATVGTITRSPYEGNARPRLGRLPKSQSILVNKGFKNDGIEAAIKRLQDRGVTIPIGLSIGTTNSAAINSVEKAIEDVIGAFRIAEAADMPAVSYYELNISCPNLHVPISFYEDANLDQLVTEIDKLSLSRPVLVKMPITESTKQTASMLKVLEKHSIAGVIFGNLHKDRTSKIFDVEEISKAGKGNFSGRPTYSRSNELIEYTYKNYKDRFFIVGSGGIFNAQDAYEKIRRGASALQLITGMIFMGPQVMAEIQLDLIEMLRRKGFTKLSDAVGSGVVSK